MTSEQHPLSMLVCGASADNLSEIHQLLERLSETISFFSKRLLRLDLLNEEQKMLAPFYSRSIMEAASTALLARLDPFRILSIYKVQSLAGYDVTKKSLVALRWTGDVLSSHKPQHLWHPETKLIDYDRALLSNYNGDLFWEPSFVRMLDHMGLPECRRTSAWVETLKEKSERTFFEQSKTEAMKLYSTFSKGVHYEFLVSVESVYDATTVQDYVVKMFQWCAEISLASHFIGIISSRLSHDDAFDTFITVEELVEEWRMTMS